MFFPVRCLRRNDKGVSANIFPIPACAGMTRECRGIFLFFCMKCFSLLGAFAGMTRGWGDFFSIRCLCRNDKGAGMTRVGIKTGLSEISQGQPQLSHQMLMAKNISLQYCLLVPEIYTAGRRLLQNGLCGISQIRPRTTISDSR